jgi:hypothetical protein
VSSHRTLVRTTVDQICRSAAARVTPEVVKYLHDRNVERIDVPCSVLHTSDPTAAPFASAVAADVQSLLRTRDIPDLHETTVTLTFTYRLRNKTCLVGHVRSSVRSFVVADVHARVRIRTRWVDMWGDCELHVEWPADDRVADALRSASR